MIYIDFNCRGNISSSVLCLFQLYNRGRFVLIGNLLINPFYSYRNGIIYYLSDARSNLHRKKKLDIKNNIKSKNISMTR